MEPKGGNRGGDGKMSVCLYSFLLYLCEVVDTPAPLGVSQHTHLHHIRHHTSTNDERYAMTIPAGLFHAFCALIQYRED
jgi:hypothetical protein